MYISITGPTSSVERALAKFPDASAMIAQRGHPVDMELIDSLVSFGLTVRVDQVCYDEEGARLYTEAEECEDDDYPDW